VRRLRNSPITAIILGCTLAVFGDLPDAEGAKKINPRRPGPSIPVNTAPTISGTPATSVLEGGTYRFAPSARDANGDPLTFSIMGKPGWAYFDSATGALYGWPSAPDVATYTNIKISVSDGQATAQLPTFSIAVQPYSLGSVTLSWLPPTENVDGTALTNLAGYRLYWGQQSKYYSNSVVIMNPGISAYVVENLANGTYYFAATAINADGVESSLSAEVSKVIP
jgi:hypothetical protein